MERIQLSLKTIYKMLMCNDYPVYSDSVIPEKMHKGQTLFRFWQGNIVEELCTGPSGSIIWKKMDGETVIYPLCATAAWTIRCIGNMPVSWSLAAMCKSF